MTANDNFDNQSSTSYLFNEDELVKYEEDIQLRINEIWTETQNKQELIQNEFQDSLENIIEECASLKFEKMAEIKFMYKKFNDDPEKQKERDQEIENVKQEMEVIKQQKVNKAKERMEEKKRKLQAEKQMQLKQVKDQIKLERPGGNGNSAIGDDQFDYMLQEAKTPSPGKQRPRRNSSVGERPGQKQFDDDDVKSAKNKKLHTDLRKRTRVAAPQTMRVGRTTNNKQQKRPTGKFDFNFEDIKEEDKEQSRNDDGRDAGSEGHVSVDIDLNQINID